MAVGALIVAIVSAVAALGAGWYARQLDKTAKAAVAATRDAAAAAKESAVASGRSASAAEKGVALETGRRHSELAPRFRVVMKREKPQVPLPSLSVFLLGPPELGHLDGLTVTIRDDPHLRDTTSVDGATPEQIAEMVWGPYQFPPSTDATSHVASGEGMKVGDELLFILQRTKPSWPPLESNPGAWQLLTRTLLLLRLEARREGWEPWTLACEIDSTDEQTTIEVPGGPINGGVGLQASAHVVGGGSDVPGPGWTDIMTVPGMHRMHTTRFPHLEAL